MHRDVLNFALVLILLVPVGSALAFGDDRYERDVERVATGP